MKLLHTLVLSVLAARNFVDEAADIAKMMHRSSNPKQAGPAPISHGATDPSALIAHTQAVLRRMHHKSEHKKVETISEEERAARAARWFASHNLGSVAAELHEAAPAQKVESAVDILRHAGSVKTEEPKASSARDAAVPASVDQAEAELERMLDTPQGEPEWKKQARKLRSKRVL